MTSNKPTKKSERLSRTKRLAMVRKMWDEQVDNLHAYADMRALCHPVVPPGGANNEGLHNHNADEATSPDLMRRVSNASAVKVLCIGL